MDNTHHHSPSGLFMAITGLIAFAALLVMIYGFVTSNLDYVKSLFGMQTESYYDYSDYYSSYYNDGMYSGDDSGAIDDSMLRDAAGGETGESEPAAIGGADTSIINPEAATGVIAVG